MKRLSQRCSNKRKNFQGSSTVRYFNKEKFFCFLWIYLNFSETLPLPQCNLSSYNEKICKIEVSGANFYSFKVNNRSTGKRCEICPKLTVKTPERHRWRRSGVSIINFEHILILFYCFYCWLWEGKYFWIGSVELFSTAASVESQFSLLQKYLL